MAGEILFNEVSTPSTPSANKDALFVSSDTPPRLKRVDSAGTVWPVQEQFLIALASDNTAPTNVNTAQAVFGSLGSGQVTLPSSMAYQFEATYILTNTGTTSHTWSALFGGTATLTSGAMVGTALSNTASAVANANQGYTTTLGSAFVLTAASTSATENVTIRLHGVVRINAGGTFIPQFQASAATGQAPVIKANSYFRMVPFGSNTATTLGPWS